MSLRVLITGAGSIARRHANNLLASLPDPAPLPEQQLEDLQQQDLLHRALAQLDERSRLFLELLYLKFS